MLLKDSVQYIYNMIDANIYSDKQRRILSYMLLEHIASYTKYDVICHADKNIDIDIPTVRKLTDSINREVPVEYIVEKTSFYNNEFFVDNRVLIPRPETEELVDIIVKDYKYADKKIDVLDICSGSGAIAISLSLNLLCGKVDAIEISEDAIAVAEINSDKLQTMEVNFICCDILKQEILPSVYDVIVSNPPYVTHKEKLYMKNNVLNNEPHRALFVDDDVPLLFYDKIARLAYGHLMKEGRLYFEINEMYGPDMVSLLHRIGYSDVKLYKDLFDKDRFIRAAK